MLCQTGRYIIFLAEETSEVVRADTRYSGIWVLFSFVMTKGKVGVHYNSGIETFYFYVFFSLFTGRCYYTVDKKILDIHALIRKARLFLCHGHARRSPLSGQQYTW